MFYLWNVVVVWYNIICDVFSLLRDFLWTVSLGYVLNVIHRVGIIIRRGSVYWLQQANWEKLYNYRKIGIVSVRTLKNKVFSSSSFLIFCLNFRGEFLRSSNIDVYIGKMPTKYMPKSKFETNPCRPCSMFVYCMNPTSSWNRGFVRWDGWVSIFVNDVLPKKSALNLTL